MSMASIFGSLLKLHYDATTLADGAVSSWSSIATDTTALAQATGSRQPVRSATAFNGLPGVTSDGGDALACVLSSPIAAGARPYALIVAKLVSVAAGGALLKVATAAEVDQFEIFIGTGGSGDIKIVIYRDDDSGAGVSYTAGAADTLARLYEAGFTAGGTAGLVVDGAERDTVDSTGAVLRSGAPAADITRIRLFADTGTPSFFTTAVVAEIVLLSDAPSASQLALARAELRAKWALQDTIQTRTEIVDLRTLDAGIAAAGEGNFTDCGEYAGYIHYAPTTSTIGHHKMARYNTALGFKDPAAWEFQDHSTVDSTFKHFEGCIAIGRYLYLPTSGTTFHRYDMADPSFASPSASSFKKIDLATLPGIGTATDYIFPFYDGARYLYLAQLNFQTNTGIYMIRYDTLADFESTSSYQLSPATTLITALAMGFMGGEWIAPNAQYPQGAAFFCAHQYSHTMHGNHIVWNPALGSFSTLAAWSTFNTESISANYRGYSDATILNGYIYLCPGETTETVGDSWFLARWNTALPFTDAGSWEFYDIRNVNSRLRGLTGVWNDARYIVWAENEGPGDGAALMFDTMAGGGFGAAASYEFVDSRWYVNGYNKVYGFSGGVSFDGYHYVAPYHRHYAMRVRSAIIARSMVAETAALTISAGDVAFVVGQAHSMTADAAALTLAAADATFTLGAVALDSITATGVSLSARAGGGSLRSL